jgi:hypothetical protein
MKRLLFTIVLVLALLVPSGALGSALFYKGTLQGGVNNAGIAFRVKFKNQRPRKVLRIEFYNVAAPPCYYSYGPIAPGWTVNRRHKFHGTLHFNGGSASATVTGTLKKRSNHYKKIVGTFRAHGPSQCDTGTLNYVAKKGG